MIQFLPFAPLLLILGPIGFWFTWDAWKRYLKHQENLASMRASHEGLLLRQVGELKAELDTVLDDVSGSIEKNRAILKGFLDSMTDIVKLSEEEKSNLKNRLAAARLDKKVQGTK